MDTERPIVLPKDKHHKIIGATLPPHVLSSNARDRSNLSTVLYSTSTCNIEKGEEKLPGMQGRESPCYCATNG